ncbi:MAG: YlxR family protein [Clostridia bacterium]
MPSRKCIGCNQMKEKNLLLRIVKNKDGDIFFDSTGKANGRGAYL